MQTYKRAHYWLGFCICIMEPVVHHKHCLFQRGLLHQCLKLRRLQPETKILQCKCVSILLCYDMKARRGSSKTLFSQAGNSFTGIWNFHHSRENLFTRWHVLLEKKATENLPASLCRMLQIIICPLSSSSNSSGRSSRADSFESLPVSLGLARCRFSSEF